MKKQPNPNCYKKNQLGRAFSYIDLSCKRCDIYDVSHDAKLLYEHVFESGRIFRGKMLEGMYIACVYEACKKNNYKISERDILDMFEEINYITLKKCSEIIYGIIDSEIKKLKSIVLFMREICYLQLERDIFSHFLAVMRESKLCDTVIIRHAIIITYK
jgi:transcription initiation factor TFIIIB Brf1 subunit/transcription initiation factor TFIIB